MSSSSVEISPDSESIRLFDSDFLEFFTHVSPITITVVWVPVIGYFIYTAIQQVAIATFPWYIPAGIVMGIVLWSVSEYLLHRFFFHFKPSSPKLEKFFYMFHGVHHDRPQDKTRLVMPLPVSVPLAVVFYGLFYLVFATVLNAYMWVMPVMAGFLIGYLLYDLTHYATHHFPMRTGYLKFIKRYHMMHHYKDPDVRFGVSSPFWDYIFRTTGGSQDE
jgi:sterol desaturase/sphingolipid hydroxylase (fatty acid hydroxylase superfamily)